MSITQPVCICSLKYPAGIVHAPYCYLWHAPFVQRFPYCLINGMILFFGGGGGIEHKMCVSSFSTTLAEIFFILRRTEGGMIENVHWSSYKIPFILVQL